MCLVAASPVFRRKTERKRNKTQTQRDVNDSWKKEEKAVRLFPLVFRGLFIIFFIIKLNLFSLGKKSVS